MGLILILGGARSGKSRRALELAAEMASAAGAPPPIFIATAEPLDAEMQARITRHQQERGASWRLVEAPRDPAAAIAELAAEGGGGQVLLLDCLTVWLGNLMLAPEFAAEDRAQQEARLDAAMDVLLQVADNIAGTLIMVANEVGTGIVPANAAARAFRDYAGRLNQRLAARADRVEWVIAGLPVKIKPAA